MTWVVEDEWVSDRISLNHSVIYLSRRQVSASSVDLRVRLPELVAVFGQGQCQCARALNWCEDRERRTWKSPGLQR